MSLGVATSASICALDGVGQLEAVGPNSFMPLSS